VRAKFLINEGGVHFDAGRYDAAAAAFERALELDPASFAARTNLASVRAQTGHLAAAESLYVAALAVDPDDRNTRFNLELVRAERGVATADSARAAGRPNAALTAYREAREALGRAASLAPGDSAVARAAARIDAAIAGLAASGAPRP
jgi:tetratricopeptide (TPR) repeat protein